MSEGVDGRFGEFGGSYVPIVNVSGRGDKDVATVREGVQSSNFKVPGAGAEIAEVI